MPNLDKNVRANFFGNRKFCMAVDDKPTVLNISQHASFIDSYFDDSNDFLRVVEKISMSHIRMNVLYWATGTLSLIARDKLAARKNDVYSYVVSCWQPEIGTNART